MGIWSSLDKNAQLALVQSSQDIYRTSELTWMDYIPIGALKRHGRPPSKVNRVTFAIDRLTVSSIELCWAIRNAGRFVFGIHKVSSGAIQDLQAVSRKEKTAADVRPVLSTAISEEIAVAGTIDHRLLNIIADLTRLRDDSIRDRDLKITAVNGFSTSIKLPQLLAQIAAGLSVIVALIMIIERSIAYARGSDFTFDLPLIVLSSLFGAASGICGAQVKSATERKKVYEEECAMLTSTCQHTTDTLHSVQGYTHNFQVLQDYIADAERSLWDGTPLQRILDRFLKLQSVFEALRKQEMIAQRFINYYNFPEVHYAVEVRFTRVYDDGPLRQQPLALSL
ncbi:hypothetical protein FRB94_014533 [Tulasnella sp. JGI-2019a]|nr:hypothetical protein FRB94_014533 [Tulasnella sp. JGI-2019a]